MTRIRLKNRFLKNRSVGNREQFRKQRNLCVLLFKKSKKEYFPRLELRIKLQISDNAVRRFSSFCQRRFNLQVKLTSLKKIVL